MKTLKQQQIYTIGETVLDIIFKGNKPVTASPGGSSFNASVTLGRLGLPVHFISELGKDRVGDIILDFLDDNGVDSNSVSRFENGKSAIALAFLNEKSDAEYEFYKDYPHQRLNVDIPDFNRDDLLLFGSFYALNPGIRLRVKAFLDNAKKAGSTILYDPNFRDSHSHERDELLSDIEENISYATIVRASDEDMANIFDVNNPDDAWECVKSFCPVLIYTANAKGVFVRTNSLKIHMEVEQIVPVSTIGAGDTFNAGLAYGLYKRAFTRKQIEVLAEDQWREIIKSAITFSREVCLSYDNYLPTGYARSLIG